MLSPPLQAVHATLSPIRPQVGPVRPDVLAILTEVGAIRLQSLPIGLDCALVAGSFVGRELLLFGTGGGVVRLAIGYIGLQARAICLDVRL